MIPTAAPPTARWPLRLLVALASAVLLLGGYWGLWRLYFASEDFLILGHLAGRPLAEVFLDGSTGPWLGLSHVNFYRPVSTFLLALALRVFGLQPVALHLGLLLLHGLGCLLAGSIARHMTGSRAVALATGAGFAVSPLHPGAVAFIGGHATVLGGLFSLLALEGYLRHRQTGSRAAYGVSLGAFGLALGAYEAALVLPAALVAVAWVRPPGSWDPEGEDTATGVPGKGVPGKGLSGGERWTKGLCATLPFFGLAAVYLLLRRAVLGVFVGGYTAFRDRLLSDLPGLAADLLRSLPRLIVPRFDPPLSQGLALGLGAAIVLAAILFLPFRRHAGPLAPAILSGLVWAAVFQAPFFFVGVVPATGRFWYLASFAATMAVLALAWGVLESGNRRLRWYGRSLWGGLTIAVLVHGLVELRSDLESYFEADRQVRGIQAALAQRAAADPGRPLLVTGVPDFVLSASGFPVAKVFQYGLQDAVRPPFGDSSSRVYPVPRDAHPSRLPAAARAVGGEALRWDRERFRLDAISGPGEGLGETLPEILLTTSPSAAGDLSFRCATRGRVRLFLLTPGAPYRGPWRTLTGAAGTAGWPAAFLEGMARHYQGGVVGWLEQEGPEGRPAAVSEVFVLPLSSFRGRG